MTTTTVPTAAEQAAQPQIGTRTLCQHPGCGQPIELVPPAGPPDPVDHPVWAHVLFGTWVGPDHEATPVEQPEPSPGELLVASIQQSYERHRLALTLPREVFTDPEELVFWLCRIAEAHGLPVDRGPGSLEAQTRIAAVLRDLLLAAPETPEQVEEREAMEAAAESSIALLRELAGGEQR